MKNGKIRENLNGDSRKSGFYHIGGGLFWDS